MKRNILSSLLAGLALSTTAIVPAQASVMTSLAAYSGPLYFDLVGADQGSLYLADCNSASECDTSYNPGPPATGALGIAAAGAVGSEDSWGIFRVKAIYGDPLQSITVWQQTATNFLIGTFGGLVDQSVVLNANGSQTAYSSGGGLNMYEVGSLTNYNSALALGAGARVGSTVTGVDGVGTLILSANFVGTAESLITGNYQNTFTAGTRVLNGNGYLQATGGSAAPLIQDGFVLDGNFDPQDISLTTVNNPGNQAVPHWLTGFVGTAVAYDIPEPASLALTGFSLLALATLRRRKTS